MTLSPGTKLGPYEIQSQLGAGGMGEVYRARDSRLDRIVAVKILPVHLAETSDARERFDREARAISSLSHPNICPLYDVGSQDGLRYLVMEYLEGETLADRLMRGPLPLAQVLQYGIEICEGLDKAHRTGVVHRDLKPANIMLTKLGAKLMDFGLAKSVSSAFSASGLSATMTSPDKSHPLTAEGTVVGTSQYMSPEQVEGKEVDARSDIFSFGSVLYEMVTGRRAFPGRSQISVASAILEKDPEPMSSLQPLTPPALDHAIRRCLAKDPENRWQMARDLLLELKWIAEAPSSQSGAPAPIISHRKLRERLAWVSVAVLALTLILLLTVFRSHVSTSPTALRFVVSPPENSYINAAAGAAVSPDGHSVAFVAPDSTGQELLWVRALDSLTARPLAGTGGAAYPFWSPDSRQIGFFANFSSLKKIDVSGGPPIMITSVIAGNGGTWNRNDVIVFGTGVTRLLYRVSAAGGDVVPITKEDETVSAARRRVHFMPDGNHYLYDAPGSGNGRDVYVASLDSNSGKRLIESGTSPVYQQGRLLYLRGGTLVAQPFDEKRLETIGLASTLAEQVQSFSASQTGAVLTYWTGAERNPPQLIWYDRSGKQIGTLGAPARQGNAHISPDGTKVAAEIYDPQISETDSDIWLYDIARGVKSRFTAKPGTARGPCWSPDGKHIVFSSNRRGHFDLYQKSADGSGTDQLLYESEIGKYCQDWSPDGKSLLLMTVSISNRDLWTLPVFGDRKPIPYLQTEFSEAGGRYSPDGKWIAYYSDESGSNEVYVRSVLPTGGKSLISSSGGSIPRWRRDGKEIFYLSTTGELMAAAVKDNGSALEIGIAKPLFQMHLESFLPSYDVTSDGQRILVVTSLAQKQPSPITVVVNWNTGLDRQ